MKRLLLNGPLAMIIGLGVLTLSKPAAARTAFSCEGGWELQCDGNVCCTVCQATGKIGDCEKAT